MKKLLLSSVALLGFTAGAMAADLPRRAAPPIYAPIPVFTWTGFYVGVNAGYGWKDTDDNTFLTSGERDTLVGPDAPPELPPLGQGPPAGRSQ